jgi:hypothetical protein
MKAKLNIIGVIMALCPQCWARGEPANPTPRQPIQSEPASPGAKTGDQEAERKADNRYEEMLNRMKAAVEEIAQLYGNPIFLQVFTNDAGRASELKQRLRTARTGEEIRQELADLEKRRADLLNDIALREREVARLSGRLVRQRAALDALSSAVEQARLAVEETSK